MLLDTDVLIDLLTGNKKAKDFLYSLPEDSPHCCSVITVAEIHSGMREAERDKTTELIASLDVIPVNLQIAELAGKLRRDHNPFDKKAPSGNPELELDDCLIAATVVVKSLVIATRNIRYYSLPGVRIHPATY